MRQALHSMGTSGSYCLIDAKKVRSPFGDRVVRLQSLLGVGIPKECDNGARTMKVQPSL